MGLQPLYWPTWSHGLLTLFSWHQVGGLYGGWKKDNSRKISIFYLQKLMAMSSYMVNSKYVDPKFPPCEEYSQNNYISDQGSDFFSPAQDTDFQQHPGLYTRPNYADQPFSCATTVQDGAVPPRGHVHDAVGSPSPFTGGRDEQSSPVQMTGPRTCGQEQNTKSQNGIQAKLPAVVYPWMKKVHVTTGTISFCLHKIIFLVAGWGSPVLKGLRIHQCNIYESLWRPHQLHKS